MYSNVLTSNPVSALGRSVTLLPSTKQLSSSDPLDSCLHKEIIIEILGMAWMGVVG